MAKKNQKAPQLPAATPVFVTRKPEAAKVDFDAWWAMNEKKIPVQHRKEIVLADFGARGLSLRETMQSYNDALKKYGVKLK